MVSTVAEQLKEKFGGHWNEHPDHIVKNWKDEVAKDDTRLGYWEWVAQKIQQN